jgi:hypothetical protein
MTTGGVGSGDDGPLDRLPALVVTGGSAHAQLHRRILLNAPGRARPSSHRHRPVTRPSRRPPISSIAGFPHRRRRDPARPRPRCSTCRRVVPPTQQDKCTDRRPLPSSGDVLARGPRRSTSRARAENCTAPDALWRGARSLAVEQASAGSTRHRDRLKPRRVTVSGEPQSARPGSRSADDGTVTLSGRTGLRGLPRWC